ncbi:MAG: hypothetical protein II508_00285 [Acholeplasmatales bacterium]|nr:hypothetical protein [Acholeplasmatales bacterium]
MKVIIRRTDEKKVIIIFIHILNLFLLTLSIWKRMIIGIPIDITINNSIKNAYFNSITFFYITI